MTTFHRWTIVSPAGHTIPYRGFPKTFQTKKEARRWRVKRGYSSRCQEVRAVIRVERTGDV